MGKYFKEGIIIILLTIVIIVLLIIALYDYAPNKKTISDVEMYNKTQATSDVLTEISTATLENNKPESVITSYTITASDLSTYARANIYNQGRGNPFATVETETTDTTAGQTNTATSSNTSNTGSTNSVSANTTNNTTNTNTTNTTTGYFTSTGTNK